MTTIEQLKELEAPETPVFVFDCTLPTGDVYRWSTHKVTVGGNIYAARVLKHNLFELRAASNDGTDGLSKISITLANGDSFLSAVERTTGWKGAQITAQFLFYDFLNGVPATDTEVLFRGIANPPDESTDSYLRLSFTNRLNLQRSYLPEVRIQKRCPWTFPTDLPQRTEAVDGGSRGIFSTFYRCGYSADVTSGVGNLASGQPYTSCDYSRTQCAQRGMFDKDNSGNPTRRFGGIEFVPSSILVRSYGEKGSHASFTLDNQARYNDYIPLIYGTGWYLPPVVFARNDGNLTHTEVLLGGGEMQSVVKVIVNGVEIPEGVAGADMTATGWYNVFTLGARDGAFNLDFKDSSGQAVGDPYGSLACLSVVVPNRISDGRSLPQIQVLAQGVKIATFNNSGNAQGLSFGNNPAWVLLDVLMRSGWSIADLDLPSFATVASYCSAPVQALDLNGNPALIPRYQCNILITSRRSVADIVRGIRTAAQIYLTYNKLGQLQIRTEDSLANQQPAKPIGSNSTEPLNGGWPAYEFGDNAFSGILRRPNGQPSFRTWTRSSADTPNLFTVEFQDEFNEYQQDSLSLTDLDDTLLASQEVTTTLSALGLPNFNQATRITSLHLEKSVHGNMYVDFETSVRAVNLRPGDLITITYSREGWDRQPFRVVRIAPTTNYRTAAITAQIHDDDWYAIAGGGSTGNGRLPGFQVGLPRPLLGTKTDSTGASQFDIAETSSESSDGSASIQLSAAFVNPVKSMSVGSSVPLVGLNAQLSTTGGTLMGGQTLYYGVTALDSSGAESGLSFLVKAAIPAGTNTNQVTLPSLSFSSKAASFNVYRGVTPAQLLKIAAALPIAAQYNDTGAKVTLVAPPDINYDHANFYWRIELQTEETVDIHSSVTIGNNSLQMLTNEYSGAVVRILHGTGTGQERTAVGNSATTITLTSPWTIEPDATSTFTVSESSWHFGATGATSPIAFEVPNREATTVQISGRSANVRNDEAPYELSPLTRWTIVGAGGSSLDSDVPPAPVFGVSAIGQGTIEVQSISFNPILNTRSIAAGTLTVGYWDELQNPSPYSLASALENAAGSLTLSTPVAVSAGDLIQIDSEVMVVQQAVTGLAVIAVSRGDYGTAAASHVSGSLVYLLGKKIFVLPFAKEFFGSLASGSYAYPVFLPDARVATAELFVTNSRGNSDVTRQAFTQTSDLGLRTLSGGQISIQVEGNLAIQTDAAPPLTIDASHSVNDVFANVGTAPTGAPVQLLVKRSGQPYCTLTIPPGSTASNVVNGFSLGPLQAKSLIGLDIVSVSQTSDTLPGSDLTVTIRL